jgi:hypothetical protein
MKHYLGPNNKISSRLLVSSGNSLMVIAEAKYTSRGALKTLLDTTMEQIEEKGYCERYAAAYERVAQLAVAFSGKRIGCCMKELSPNQTK